MVMAWDEYEAQIQRIIDNPEDLSVITEVTTALSEDYSNVIKHVEESQSKITELTDLTSKQKDGITRLAMKVTADLRPPTAILEQNENEKLKNVSLNDIKERKLV